MDPNMDDDDDDIGGFPTIQVAPAVQEEEQRQKKKKSGGFQSMNLNYNLLKGILKKGYQVPTPIQRKAIPPALDGNDVVAMARTGSGKTAAFLIPMLHKLKEHSTKVGIRAVVLSPTRELAIQTFNFAKELGKFTGIRICHLIGGDSLNAQFDQLAQNPDVVIATPGRLMHHLQQIGMTLERVEYLVFDEADRLFEMGFASQLQEIIKSMRDTRQTMLFSATLPSALAEFARAGLNNPVTVRLDVETQLSADLKMSFFTVRPHEKIALLLHLLRDVISPMQQTVIFVATRHHVDFLSLILERAQIDSCVVYGAMDLDARKISISKFRNRKTRVLIVTDVAARGIDIPLLDNVINYDFPPKPKLFIHRVGRVARAGRSGTAYSFVAPDELAYMVELHLFLGRSLAKNQAPEGSASAPIDEMAAYYGSVPEGLLEIGIDWVKELVEKDTEVWNAQKAVDNATKLYIKTRTVASPESTKRAKECQIEGVMPWIMDSSPKLEIWQIYGPQLWLSSNSARGRNQPGSDQIELLKGIRNFKPVHTIWEARLSDNVSKEASEMMNRKRKQHDRAIAGRQNEEKLKQAEMEEAEEEEEDSKANGYSSEGSDGDDDNDDSEPEPAFIPSKSKKQKVYKDEEFFISNTPSNLNAHKERGLQINEKTGYISQDAVLDLAPDEKVSAKKKPGVKWDRKKKRFIGEDPNEKLGKHAALRDNRN